MDNLQSGLAKQDPTWSLITSGKKDDICDSRKSEHLRTRKAAPSPTQSVSQTPLRYLRRG